MRTLRSGLVTAMAAACMAGMVAPAQADDPTWTVTPGGQSTGTATNVTLKDMSTGSTLTCASSTAQATVQSGSGLSGTGIATVTSSTYTSCTGPLGLSFSVDTGTVDYQLNASSYADGVTTGTLSGITASMSGLLCSASVAGATASTPGTVNGTYTNSTATLAVTGGDLHIWNVSGCFGLINSGDAVSITANYALSPGQTITSP
jgi:hypothetical protein